MKEIIVIYNNPEQRKEIEEYEGTREVYISFLDYGSKLCKKKAWELMENWGARKLPFVLIKENDKVVHCLYTEDGDKVIRNLKKYYL